MNLVYHTLTRNLGAAEKAQFDLRLVPREQAEKTIDQQNAEQMKLLMGGRMPAGRKPVPLKHRQRKK